MRLYIVTPECVHVLMLISGQSSNFLNGVEASLSSVNGSIVEDDKVFSRRTVQVSSNNGTSKALNFWTRVDIQFRRQELHVESLVTNKVEFYFSLSRPNPKHLRLNISWTDEVTTDLGTANSYCVNQQVPRVAANADGVPKLFPKLLCIGDYPPATTFIQVPFKLLDYAVVGRKPCSISHEKKMWLKTGLQRMFDAVIIRSSVSLFAPSITIVTKEDRTQRLCINIRLMNRQAELLPFPMPKVQAVHRFCYYIWHPWI